ncbi:MAG: DUF952 domain-containing protein [Rhodospirillaceae bacterium]
MPTSTIYHMSTKEEWEIALATGVYHGSSQDREDGFIHFSTKDQIVDSAAKHRAGQTGIILIAADASMFNDGLKWETSRNGELFPHLYTDLDLDKVIAIYPLPLGPDGKHIFPKDF